jgi:hypothetical protein
MPAACLDAAEFPSFARKRDDSILDMLLTASFRLLAVPAGRPLASMLATLASKLNRESVRVFLCDKKLA